MLGFRLAAQKPPEAKRITDTVVMRSTTSTRSTRSS